ncbi:unnamed protein product [Ectocarpus sp. 8 AP-2014]
MESNGVEEMNQLGGSGGTIQLALDALKEKKGSVDQVVDYCESSYLEPGANKREVKVFPCKDRSLRTSGPSL